MNKYCIHLKKRKNKPYCNILKQEIRFFLCRECDSKEYKQYKPMKSRTNKQAKKEKERKSIFTENLAQCYLCGKRRDHLHEIFFGRNRQNSIKYGLVIPVCFECHKKIHNDIILQNKWHKIGQKKFNEVYPNFNFVEIFKKNYLN